MPVLKSDPVEIVCDNKHCGVLFIAADKEEGRRRWKAEGWQAHQVRTIKIFICPDCAIGLMDLSVVQKELRNPKPNSTVWRRQALWRRLDKLVAKDAVHGDRCSAA